MALEPGNKRDYAHLGDDLVLRQLCRENSDFDVELEQSKTGSSRC